ncbi:hypothetical protein [Larkinella soli]|uniref:hypothetical protein n=1 Tax=Larkinella soli TaxID=1770527 RepID=UPI000FFC301D|nr:hypothetical protein [Larkinella soli]
MKKLAILLLFLSGAFGQTVRAQNNPTADEVMNNYLTAIGGKDFLSKIENLTIQMSTEMQGNPMLVTRKQKAPNKFTQVMNAGGMEVFKMVSDGSKISMISPRGNQTMEGKDAQQAIMMGTLFPELHMAALGVKNTLDGVEKIDGKDAYKITHTAADGSYAWTDFYDTGTGLKVQTVAMQKTPRGEMQQTIRYGDYKDFKGLKYPTTISQGNGQFQMQLTVDKVRVNEGVKDSDFVVSQ